ncbi:MAG: Spy/CpxP family protein refolding chaperone [Acidobacteriota bacterium]|jgi:Spy/CpxP family protein refolding chaperone
MFCALVALLLLLVLPPLRAGAGPRDEPAEGVPFRVANARLSRIWWNQPRPVEVLGLTADQRRAMDELLVDHLERRRELAREFMEARRTFGDHLAAGEWEEAEAVSDRVAERFGAIARAEAELAAAVSRLLRPEQRVRLDEELPLLLRRPWVSGGLGAPSRGASRLRNRSTGEPPGS